MARVNHALVSRTDLAGGARQRDGDDHLSGERVSVHPRAMKTDSVSIRLSVTRPDSRHSRAGDREKNRETLLARRPAVRRAPFLCWPVECHIFGAET